MEGASRHDPFAVQCYRQWLYLKGRPIEEREDKLEEEKEILDKYVQNWRLHHQRGFMFGGMFPGFGNYWRGGGYPGMHM